jgi:hypothetical protein
MLYQLLQVFYFNTDISEGWKDRFNERQIKMEDNEKCIKLHLKLPGFYFKHVGGYIIQTVLTVIVYTYNKSI